MSDGNWLNMASVRAANRNLGEYFFSRDTMAFFASRVESPLYGGRFFLTGEKTYNGRAREYRVRRAANDGSIDTIGEPHAHKADARDLARTLAKLSDYDVASIREAGEALEAGQQACEYCKGPCESDCHASELVCLSPGYVEVYNDGSATVAGYNVSAEVLESLASAMG